MTILLAIFVFGLVIFVHEFGHFLAARANRVNINEFAIGMGPTIFKKEKDGTIYSLRLLPIGGFLSMEGEEGEETEEEILSERSFLKKSPLRRLTIVAAGAFMNILLGYLILIGLNMSEDVLVTRQIAAFNGEDSASYAAGLRVGDEILKIGGYPVNIGGDIMLHMSRVGSGPVDVVVRREGKKLTLPDVSFPTREVSKEYLTGDPADAEAKEKILTPDFKVRGEKMTIAGALRESYYKTLSVAQMIWTTLFDLVAGRQKITVLSGPVGVVGAIGTAASEGFSTFLSLVVLLTINLGFVNMLPIPALDGGKALFILAEGITKKKLNPKVENYIHMAGFAFVMLLALVVTFNDILRLAFK